jgi:hypothetical protein
MQPDDSTKHPRRQASAADRPGVVGQEYEIRVKGQLDARWASSFSGLRLTNEDDGTTLIHGPIVDQAALHGLLQQLRDMGMPLLSVTPVRADGLHPGTTDASAAQTTATDH